MTASRPDRSAERMTREWSANRSTAAPPTIHRHGWLLCSDGALHAMLTALAMSSVSGVTRVTVAIVCGSSGRCG